MTIDQNNQMSSARLEFLVFTLGEENYGVDILKVREIRGWEKIRELHDTPEYVRGVMDLRGSIVPVIDLRMRFGVENYQYTSSTVNIILATGSEESMMGVVVDSVSDVLSVDQDQIKDAPSLGTRINTDYVQGIVSIDGDMVMLVDSNRLLDPEAFEVLTGVEGVA